MVIEILETNRSFVKEEVNKHIDRLFDELKKTEKKLIEKDKELFDLKNQFSVLARAYAKKVGVLVTKKTDNQIEKETIKMLQENNQHLITGNSNKKQ